MNETVSITSPGTAGGLQAWPYIRYAEVLLNYAEALNEADGPVQSVYNAVNAVRHRSGIDDLAAGLSKSEMRDIIWGERHVELAFEEHRWYDVRRWKIANVAENIPGYGIKIVKSGNSFTYERIIALSMSFTDKHYWLPIPREEILSSDGKLVQNDGY